MIRVGAKVRVKYLDYIGEPWQGEIVTVTSITEHLIHNNKTYTLLLTHPIHGDSLFSEDQIEVKEYNIQNLLKRIDE